MEETTEDLLSPVITEATTPVIIGITQATTEEMETGMWRIEEEVATKITQDLATGIPGQRGTATTAMLEVPAIAAVIVTVPDGSHHMRVR